MNELQNYERASDIIFSNLSNFYEKASLRLTAQLISSVFFILPQGLRKLYQNQLITSFYDIPSAYKRQGNKG